MKGCRAVTVDLGIVFRPLKETAMSFTRPLRLVLLGNAFFSTACALLMQINPVLLGDLLGVQAPLIYRLIGVGLLVFAADLVHQASRPRLATWRALYASAGDVLWVLATIVGLLLFPGVLSPIGLVTVSLMATVMLVFGLLQMRGIRIAHRAPERDLNRHCIMVRVDVPAPAMWEVIRRIGDIQRYMPSLKSSQILYGREPGVGAVRHCVDQAGKSWSEECIAFTPGREFTVRFLADEPGFPFPASEMFGGWEVMPEEQGGGEREGSVVKVWWELTTKPAWLAPLLLPLLAFQADRDFTGIIEAMAGDARGEPVSRRATGSGVRLLPLAC